jgi:hypothetical protein
MIAPASLRDRLPSAVAAIALQGGLLALLVLSFEVVRHVAPEKETFITLPPPARPQVQRAPVVIDARGKTPPRQAAPPQAPPAAAQPSLAVPASPNAITPPATAPQDTSRDLTRCEIGNYANLSPAERQRCPPPPKPAPDANDVTGLLNPPSHVKDEARWQAEMERKNNPPDAGIAVGPGIGFAIQDPLCKLAAFVLGGLKCGALPSNHIFTDAQFQAARAATQARTRALHGRPVLGSAPKTGGGDAKDPASGNGGTGRTGGTGGTGGNDPEPVPGPGR